ncbi:CapA family protein [Bacillus sp. FJAT-42376]|uniref:CapA family protein n=1 Tax=Bacillus sp. FJAT-42376 TaxID=2014076 RepID=UPI000F4F5303|nr:CapA family protein [Bacillus sp. FJAT-42376]AZB44352.1 CapA family protein [Bacillus sp. FJAT-42376]
MSHPNGKELNFEEKLLRFIKRNRRNSKTHAVIGLIATAGIMFGFSFAERPPAPAVTQYKNEVFTASFMGDVMMGRDVEKVTDIKGQDYLFQHVKPLLQNSDYITANFDQPITLDEDAPKNESKSIQLRTDKQSAKTLQNLNFSSVSLANTHAMDYNVQGLNDTRKTLKEHAIDPVGAGSNLKDAKDSISYQNYNGMKVATLAFTDVYAEGTKATEYNSGVLAMEPKNFVPMIAEAKKNADFVFVHAHWGQEYDTTPHPRQEDLAKALADAGADVIIGHHPHVLSPVEVYKDSVIFYSLGNFVFDQGWSRTRESALAQMRLMADGKARFELTPLEIKEGQPAPIREMNELQRKKMVQQLTKTSKNLDWKEENGKLIFEKDFSKKLD